MPNEEQLPADDVPPEELPLLGALAQPEVQAVLDGILSKAGGKRIGMNKDQVLRLAHEILSTRNQGDTAMDLAAVIQERLKSLLGVGNDIDDAEIPVLAALEGVDVTDPAAMTKAVTELAQDQGAKKVLSRLLPGRTVRNQGQKIGVNDKCPCGSGQKFKRCCRGKAK